MLKKQINITIKIQNSHYVLVREGGSLFVSGANASLFCLVFIRSHTKTRRTHWRECYSFYDTGMKMTDFVVSGSWIDPECGDSIHHIVRCSAKIAGYNISDSNEGNLGGARGDFWAQKSDSLVSFARLVPIWEQTFFHVRRRRVFLGGTEFSE